MSDFKSDKFLPPKKDNDPPSDRDDWASKILPPDPVAPDYLAKLIQKPNYLNPDNFPPRDTGTGRPPAPKLTPAKPTAPQGQKDSHNATNSGLPADIVQKLTPQKEARPDPLEELDRMIGLTAVKDEVKKTLSLILLGKARQKANMPPLPVAHHLVFTGNPGTGKTTVARIIGRIYQEHGLLKSGHLVETDRSGLVGAYQGQTALRVEEVVNRALDGVLFIDEAYNLVQPGKFDTFGAEAVATLIKLMEDKRDRLVVIAAGYSAEMKAFIDSNPGLASRFKTYIKFPDYTALELMEILQSLCSKAGVQMSMDAMKKAADTFMTIDRGKNFGNGRTVRNMFEECIARQAMRLAERGEYGEVNMGMIEAGDVPAAEDVQA